jgi:hypothetical protein
MAGLCKGTAEALIAIDISNGRKKPMVAALERQK